MKIYVVRKAMNKKIETAGTVGKYPELPTHINGCEINGKQRRSLNYMYGTVMGDSVNLGSRLEGANKQYNTCIMISEFTLKAAKRCN